MNTLLGPPLAPLLAQLFAESDASQTRLEQMFSKLSPEERDAKIKSENYLEFYGELKDFALPVSRESGRLLYMLVRATNARSVVEFGMSFGISTLHIAAALKDNGGGRVITTEFEASKVIRARNSIKAAGLSEFVEIREGDALQTLARDLPPAIDLVLLDGAKTLYPRVLTLLEAHLRPGALLLADNAEWSAEYLTRVRAPDGGYLSVPFGNDVELSIKIDV
jgi:predicted O-methyltransferase YrrM